MKTTWFELGLLVLAGFGIACVVLAVIIVTLFFALS